MKRFISLLLPVILIFALSSSVFGLADVANKSINVIEGDFQVVFIDSVHFTTSDSTNTLTTRAISDDGWLDWENAHLRVYSGGVAGDDVNFFLYGGGNLDLTYMSSTYTQSVFDDIDNGTPAAWWACKDTIQSGGSPNITTWIVDPVVGERFKVLAFDGQPGNTSGCIIYFILTVPKKPGAPHRNAYGLFDTQ